jgi:membrane fusion protein, multidrug efflux system
MQAKTVTSPMARQTTFLVSSMNIDFWRLCRNFSVAALLLLGAACSEKKDSNATSAVKIAQPLSQEVTEWDEYTGRVEAISSVDVRARVGGYLVKVNFTAGEKVQKGDLLFLIDIKPYQAQFNFASAELERAKSRLELARNDLERAEQLFRQKAISTEEYDGRSKGLREAAAAVESAKANVYTARINLDYCEIRAPISGRIGRELLTQGNLVNGGDTTVLTTIVTTDPVYVYADADEQSVLKYRRRALEKGTNSVDLKGTPVELGVADETGYPHRGELDYVAPREDTATGTISLRGVFPNRNGLLSPGFFARMRVHGSDPYPALLLPDRAVATDQTERFVWVVNADNHVDYRRIVAGALIGDKRVVSQGLQANEWVVVDGLQKLKPGIEVVTEKVAVDDTNGAR